MPRSRSPWRFLWRWAVKRPPQTGDSRAQICNSSLSQVLSIFSLCRDKVFRLCGNSAEIDLRKTTSAIVPGHVSPSVARSQSIDYWSMSKLEVASDMSAICFYGKSVEGARRVVLPLRIWYTTHITKTEKETTNHVDSHLSFSDEQRANLWNLTVTLYIRCIYIHAYILTHKYGLKSVDIVRLSYLNLFVGCA